MTEGPELLEKIRQVANLGRSDRQHDGLSKKPRTLRLALRQTSDVMGDSARGLDETVGSNLQPETLALKSEILAELRGAQRLAEGLLNGQTPQQIADAILETHIEKMARLLFEQPSDREAFWKLFDRTAGGE